MRYDIAIIGSGPAGISAAVNAKIRNKSIIIFGNEKLSQKLVLAPEINNYLGFYGITGLELKDKFKNHLDSMGIEITNQRINAVYAMGDYFVLMVNDISYEATAVIIATGVETQKPMKGEERFLGKGVSYCATCDAPLYKGKDIAIIGGNEEAIEDANFVEEMAGKLYYIPSNRKIEGLKEGIRIINSAPLEIIGDDHVNGVILRNGEIKVDAVFILKDSLSPKELVPGLETIDGHILVNRNLETNIKGLYAAGDCTGKPYQYMKSMGEGQTAALNAVSYLSKI
jgi:thioredoxin reductase (NADPH)